MARAYLDYLEHSGSGYHADWADKQHHFRRLVCEFIGCFGFVFALSGGAALFHGYAHPALLPGENAFLLAMSAGLWLVIATYALRDMSAQFNPALTLAFALRGDMSWRRAAAFWAAQFSAGLFAALMARGFFGVGKRPRRSASSGRPCGASVHLPGLFNRCVHSSGSRTDSRTEDYGELYATGHRRVRAFLRNH